MLEAGTSPIHKKIIKRGGDSVETTDIFSILTSVGSLFIGFIFLVIKLIENIKKPTERE